MALSPQTQLIVSPAWTVDWLLQMPTLSTKLRPPLQALLPTVTVCVVWHSPAVMNRKGKKNVNFLIREIAFNAKAPKLYQSRPGDRKHIRRRPSGSCEGSFTGKYALLQRLWQRNARMKVVGGSQSTANRTDCQLPELPRIYADEHGFGYPHNPQLLWLRPAVGKSREFPETAYGLTDILGILRRKNAAQDDRLIELIREQNPDSILTVCAAWPGAAARS